VILLTRDRSRLSGLWLCEWRLVYVDFVNKKSPIDPNFRIRVTKNCSHAQSHHTSYPSERGTIDVDGAVPKAYHIRDSYAVEKALKVECGCSISKNKEEQRLLSTEDDIDNDSRILWVMKNK